MRRDGSYFGTLCALDPNPAKLTETHFDIFRLLASLIAHELEEEETQQKLLEDLTAAEESRRARERLVAILSHDLRTPLTAVTFGAESLVESPTINARERQTALSIAGSARRAGRMVADLLDFTRVEFVGGIPIERARVDMKAITSKVLSEIGQGADKREINVSITGDCSGVWDGDRVAQVVANLVNNALEHGLPGEPIMVCVRGRESDVLLEVANRAVPLGAEDVTRLFSPFWRLSGRPSNGLGMGLFIVQQIMHAHGGTIDLSQSEERVTFRAVWPR